MGCLSHTSQEGVKLAHKGPVNFTITPERRSRDLQTLIADEDQLQRGEGIGL